MRTAVQFAKATARSTDEGAFSINWFVGSCTPRIADAMRATCRTLYEMYFVKNGVFHRYII